MPANRIVALLTPVAAALAGAITAWLARHAPGVEIAKDQLTAIFIAAIGITFAGSAQWLHGWQKHEAREAETARAADVADDAELEVTSDERSVMPLDADAEFDEADEDLFDGIDDPMLDDEEDEALFETVGAGSERGE
jgi:hypothetical protein